MYRSLPTLACLLALVACAPAARALELPAGGLLHTYDCEPPPLPATSACDYVRMGRLPTTACEVPFAGPFATPDASPLAPLTPVILADEERPDQGNCPRRALPELHRRLFLPVTPDRGDPPSPKDPRTAPDVSGAVRRGLDGLPRVRFALRTSPLPVASLEGRVFRPPRACSPRSV
jgi:hypothetical protein